MAKPKDFTHTVAGAEGTRKSPRVYTHATVVTYDPVWYAKHKEAGRIESVAKRAADYWDYLARSLANEERLTAEAKAEDAAFSAKLEGYARERPDAGINTVSTIHIDSITRTLGTARDMLIRWGNRDGYIAAETTAERQRIDAEYALGVYRYVLSWHQSPTAAAAFARTTANNGDHPCVEVCETERK